MSGLGLEKSCKRRATGIQLMIHTILIGTQWKEALRCSPRAVRFSQMIHTIKISTPDLGMFTRIIFRQSQYLWAFNHSRKIQAVAVARDNTKPHLPPMDFPD
jgi:hypothetical protein